MKKIQLKPWHILDMNAREKRKYLDSFDLILCDCDGVVWMLADPIPRTGNAIMLLKNAGKDVKFISNNSVRTDAEYMTKLRDIGIKDIQEEDVVHPVKPICHFINTKCPGQPVYSLCSEIMNESFRAEGLNIKVMKTSIGKLSNENIAQTVIPKDKVAAVLLDVNFYLNYAELALAAQYLSKDPNCLFVVGAPDDVIPIGKNETILGSAGFVTLLQNATGKQPLVMGKPSAYLKQFLVKKYNIKDESRVLFIGDNLRTDMQFARDSGFQSLLVLSGATTLEKVQSLPQDERPTYMANSLADFMQFFDDLEIEK